MREFHNEISLDVSKLILKILKALFVRAKGIGPSLHSPKMFQFQEHLSDFWLIGWACNTFFSVDSSEFHFFFENPWSTTEYGFQSAFHGCHLFKWKSLISCSVNDLYAWRNFSYVDNIWNFYFYILVCAIFNIVCIIYFSCDRYRIHSAIRCICFFNWQIATNLCLQLYLTSWKNSFHANI